MTFMLSDVYVCYSIRTHSFDVSRLFDKQTMGEQQMTLMRDMCVRIVGGLN